MHQDRILIVRQAARQKAATPEPEPEVQHEEPAAEEPAEIAHDEPVEAEQPQEEQAADSAAGFSAIALFDYQANGDDEITFDPEELVTDIEETAEGWWTGTARGHRGLFPSNFVKRV